MAPTPRAASYRQRAADITATLDGLSAGDRATALLQQRALNQLADVEDWVSLKPRIPAKHDYNLLPRTAPAPAPQRAPRALRRKKPGDGPVTDL
jgi:hypothetical protein